MCEATMNAYAALLRTANKPLRSWLTYNRERVERVVRNAVTGHVYRYGLQFRPAGYVAVPAGYVRIDPPMPEAADWTRHGVVVYDRPLTPQEIASFQLTPFVPSAEMAHRVADLMRPSAPAFLKFPARDFAQAVGQRMERAGGFTDVPRGAIASMVRDILINAEDAQPVDDPVAARVDAFLRTLGNLNPEGWYTLDGKVGFTAFYVKHHAQGLPQNAISATRSGYGPIAVTVKPGYTAEGSRWNLGGMFFVPGRSPSGSLDKIVILAMDGGGNVATRKYRVLSEGTTVEAIDATVGSKAKRVDAGPSITDRQDRITRALTELAHARLLDAGKKNVQPKVTWVGSAAKGYTVSVTAGKINMGVLRGTLDEIEAKALAATASTPAPARIPPVAPARSGRNPQCQTTGPLYDAEGRRYSIEYVVLQTAIDGSGPIRTSNLPRTFAINAQYPPDFQARDLSSPAEAAKIQKIASELDPTRVLWTHSDPTLGPPVVWPNPDGAFDVLGGNGRTLAILMAPPERYAAYLDAIREHWAALAPIEPPWPGMRYVLVRVVRRADGSPLSLRQAVMLAGASQESTSAAETPIGRALSVARGLGIFDARELPAFTWENPITIDNIHSFQEQNPAFWRALMERMDPAKRETYQQSHKAVELVRQIMVSYLPTTVRQTGFGDEATEETLMAALPLIVSLETKIQEGLVKPEWSLMAALPDAVRLYRVIEKMPRRDRPKRTEMHKLLEREADQTSMAGAEPLLAGISLLGFVLGVGLSRWSGLADPARGVADILRPYYAIADTKAVLQTEAMFAPPAGGGLFGQSYDSNPAMTLAGLMNLRIPARLPPGVRPNPAPSKRSGARTVTVTADTIARAVWGLPASELTPDNAVRIVKNGQLVWIFPDPDGPIEGQRALVADRLGEHVRGWPVRMLRGDELVQVSVAATGNGVVFAAESWILDRIGQRLTGRAGQRALQVFK